MINKEIELITQGDLQALIDNEVSERKTIEYKQILPGDSESDKKEFLADVSSFANSSGGDLIYGVTEDKSTGKPKSLDGLEIANADQEILRLESIIRDGIEPRILSIVSQKVTLLNSKFALVIRIPKSWCSPHLVSYKGHDKFYARSTNGKYRMDVGELRIAFNLSETMIERIRNFRFDRISKIIANETPVPFYRNAKIALHLIPVASFNPAQTYDISKITSDTAKMWPIYSAGMNHRYNLDGFLTHAQDREGKTHSYVQLFRNGIIEAVEGLLLEPYEKENGKIELIIPSIAYEQKIIESFKNYVSVLKTLNVEPPVFIFLGLLGVKGYSMAINQRFLGAYANRTIDRDLLLLPERVVQNYEISSEEILKPCFDLIWNACGFPRDLNFNDKGEWTPPR